MYCPAVPGQGGGGAGGHRPAEEESCPRGLEGGQAVAQGLALQGEGGQCWQDQRLQDGVQGGSALGECQGGHGLHTGTKIDTFVMKISFSSSKVVEFFL